MTTVLERLVRFGVIPIITHPERNATVVSDLSRLTEWIECGCLVQITGGSITGRFGKAAEECANQLLKQQRVHLIASDAHSMDKRPPALKEAFEKTRQRFGLDTAERLCLHNPAAVFNGEPIPLGMKPLERTHRPGFKASGRFSWIFGS